MTYTFKLARRLAILRHFVVLATLALVLACARDLTSPEGGSPNSLDNPVALRTLPRSVTIGAGQRVQFSGQARTSRRDAMLLPVAWTASGGTISADGVFSSSSIGTFKIVGRGRHWRQADTSVVIVVPAPSNLDHIAITPGSSTLDTGGTRAFTATGYLTDGSTAPVGVNWTATGGAVDPAGTYTAGKTAGSYRVIATYSSGTLADTASVTITQPSSTLASVIVSPASVSLVTGGSQQFKAYGRTSVGDSVAVTVSFTATGGTISSSGLYTAGSTGGTYRLVAAASGLADTAVVSVAQKTVTGGTVGVAFGAFNLLNAAVSPAPLTLSNAAVNASNIVTTLGTARTKGLRLMLALTGGPHSASHPGCCLSLINGVWTFDRTKWDAKMATFNTATIRDAIAKAVADGTVIGNTVMDEPFVSGGSGGDGNTWGPKGTMTKVRVDSLCAVVRQMFPTLPAGVQHGHNAFEPTKSYRVCDWLLDSYGAGWGSVTAYRDEGLAMAARDGYTELFGMNVLDGGLPDTDGTYDCTGSGQGGIGTFGNHCRMTATQVRDFGLALGPAGCGLFMWRYDDVFWSRTDNQQAFKDVAAAIATVPSKPCQRK